MVICFFFFKQKTAYEMRISDWSSDVCSSDLKPAKLHEFVHLERSSGAFLEGAEADATDRHPNQPEHIAAAGRQHPAYLAISPFGQHDLNPTRTAVRAQQRTEEHTSELQSLMRISYAAFCMTKNNTITNSW